MDRFRKRGTADAAEPTDATPPGNGLPTLLEAVRDLESSQPDGQARGRLRSARISFAPCAKRLRYRRRTERRESSFRNPAPGFRQLVAAGTGWRAVRRRRP